LSVNSVVLATTIDHDFRYRCDASWTTAFIEH